MEWMWPLAVILIGAGVVECVHYWVKKKYSFPKDFVKESEFAEAVDLANKLQDRLQNQTSIIDKMIDRAKEREEQLEALQEMVEGMNERVNNLMVKEGFEV